LGQKAVGKNLKLKYDIKSLIKSGTAAAAAIMISLQFVCAPIVGA
jgi:hypothetical protein